MSSAKNFSRQVLRQSLLVPHAVDYKSFRHVKQIFEPVKIFPESSLGREKIFSVDLALEKIHVVFAHAPKIPRKFHQVGGNVFVLAVRLYQQDAAVYLRIFSNFLMSALPADFGLARIIS